jgi:hypothetical protein
MRLQRWLALAAVVGAASVASCTTDGAIAMAAGRLAGSEKCGTCHAAEFRTWKDTYHAKMVRTPHEGLLKDALDNWAKDDQGNTGPTRGNIDGKPYTLADVQFVIGSKWKQRYLVKNPATGTHQFLDKQWNRYSSAWEPYGQKNDWESQCSTCHSAGDRAAGYGPEDTAATKAAMAAKHTSCRTCHRPGAHHAASGSKAYPQD